MITDYALRTDVKLVIFTEVLRLLLGVCDTELIDEALFHFISHLSGVDLVCLANMVHTWTNTSEVVHFFLVINVIYMILIQKLFYLPRIVKFLINCLTSGENTFLHVGQVKILLVLKSMRQIWQNVCPQCRMRGILSLSL